MVGSNGRYDCNKEWMTTDSHKIGLQGHAGVVSILNETVSFLHTLLVNYFASVRILFEKSLVSAGRLICFTGANILPDYFRDQILGSLIVMIGNQRFQYLVLLGRGWVNVMLMSNITNQS